MPEKLKILYVDDDEALLAIGKIYLEERGLFHVDTNTSAKSALSELDSQEFDAIISDYQMPGMDGIEFLKTVRKSGNTIPFILFTGRGREEIVIQALNEGADFYLQKGGSPEPLFAELTHKIRQAVQQRRAEASIRDHERREADIINFLPDATFAIDTRGIVIAWNHAMEEFSGVSSGKMLGKGDYEYALSKYHERRPVLIDLILKDDQEIKARYPDIHRSGKTVFTEIVLSDRNDGKGGIFWFAASPIYDARGRFAGAIECIRDITDRKRTEEAARESEARYHCIVEAADMGICSMDSGFVITFVNRKMADLLGYTPGEMTSRNFTDFMNPAGIANNSTMILNRRQGLDETYEREFRHKDGSIRMLHVSARSLKDVSGTFIGSFTICSDVTDREKTL